MPTQKPPRTIIIVDDDPVFAAVLGQVLAANGVADVVWASDGCKAEAVLAERVGEIDAMTLDLSMPNQDGVTFLRNARNAGFAGRLLLISGEHPSVLASAERLARILGLDCVGALPKPVDYKAAVSLLLAATAPARQGHGHSSLDPRMLETLAPRPYYQPKVRLSDGMLCGAEALARVEDGDGRQLDIEQVIEMAEEHGRIGDLTWRIIEQVVEDAVQFAAAGHHLRLSFNIPVGILEDRRFPDKLAAMMRAARLHPGDFVLELTESRIPDDVTYSLEAMTRLRMAGFHLAIDDFGTGASNIERLRIYPFTELKIDKGFVLNAAADSFSRACVETSIRLAHELSLEVVAEGIESVGELRIATECGADTGQGYLFGRPMPREQFAALVRKHAGAPMIGVGRAVA